MTHFKTESNAARRMDSWCDNFAKALSQEVTANLRGRPKFNKHGSWQLFFSSLIPVSSVFHPWLMTSSNEEIADGATDRHG